MEETPVKKDPTPLKGISSPKSPDASPFKSPSKQTITSENLEALKGPDVANWLYLISALDGKKTTRYQETYYRMLNENNKIPLFFAVRLYMGFSLIYTYDSIFEIPPGLESSPEDYIPDMILLESLKKDLQKQLKVDAQELERKIWLLISKYEIYDGNSFMLNPETSVCFSSAFQFLRERCDKFTDAISYTQFLENPDVDIKYVYILARIASCDRALSRYSSNNDRVKKDVYERLFMTKARLIISMNSFIKISPYHPQKCEIYVKQYDKTLFSNNKLGSEIAERVSALKDYAKEYSENKKWSNPEKASVIEDIQSSFISTYTQKNVDITQGYSKKYLSRLKDRVISDQCFSAARNFMGITGKIKYELGFETPHGLSYPITSNILSDIKSGQNSSVHMWLALTRFGIFTDTYILKPHIESHFIGAYHMLAEQFGVSFTQKYTSYSSFLSSDYNNEERRIHFVQLSVHMYNMNMYLNGSRSSKKMVYTASLAGISMEMNYFNRMLVPELDPLK